MAKRRPNFGKQHVPGQTRLSVQDVRDAGTPSGTAMENEEMRRIALFVNQLADKVEAGAGATDTAGKKPAVLEPGEPGGGGGEGDITQNITNITNNYTTGTTLLMLSGEVWINKRPKVPPDEYPDGDAYKYANREYDPDHGKFGYYVYAVIEHNWDLPDRNNYVLELVDQREQFRDADYLQEFLPESEGLDTNRVILHGIYKPTDEVLQYNENGDLLTNLLFDFVLIGKPTADEVQHQSLGWIVTGPAGTLWQITIDNAGALIIDQVYNTEEREVYLTAPNNTVWEVTVTADASGYAIHTTVVTGIAGAVSILIRSPDNTLWAVSIDNDGALVAT